MSALSPFPGQGGRKPYCGVGAHFYEDLGRGMRCKDCHHVKGQRVKR